MPVVQVRPSTTICTTPIPSDNTGKHESTVRARGSGQAGLLARRTGPTRTCCRCACPGRHAWRGAWEGPHHYGTLPTATTKRSMQQQAHKHRHNTHTHTPLTLWDAQENRQDTRDQSHPPLTYDPGRGHKERKRSSGESIASNASVRGLCGGVITVSEAGHQRHTVQEVVLLAVVYLDRCYNFYAQSRQRRKKGRQRL